MLNRAPARRRQRRLTATARKSVLLVHIVSAGLWFGVDIALGIGVITAMLTDPQVAAVCLRAVEMLAIWPMVGASLVCLASGVVLGVGSKYGLVRYWWVAVKLVINAVMSVLIVVALRPGLSDAADLGERIAAGEVSAAIPTDLLYPVLVAPTLLITAYVLSVFKPWGKTRYGKKNGAR